MWPPSGLDMTKASQSPNARFRVTWLPDCHVCLPDFLTYCLVLVWFFTLLLVQILSYTSSIGRQDVYLIACLALMVASLPFCEPKWSGFTGLLVSLLDSFVYVCRQRAYALVDDYSIAITNSYKLARSATLRYSSPRAIVLGLCRFSSANIISVYTN